MAPTGGQKPQTVAKCAPNGSYSIPVYVVLIVASECALVMTSREYVHTDDVLISHMLTAWWFNVPSVRGSQEVQSAHDSFFRIKFERFVVR